MTHKVEQTSADRQFDNVQNYVTERINNQNKVWRLLRYLLAKSKNEQHHFRGIHNNDYQFECKTGYMFAQWLADQNTAELAHYTYFLKSHCARLSHWRQLIEAFIALFGILMAVSALDIKASWHVFIVAFMASMWFVMKRWNIERQRLIYEEIINHITDVLRNRD